ncbi:MAG: hypothetical protein ACO1QS_06805 [Verrucomicrobiota bacterium]
MGLFSKTPKPNPKITFEGIEFTFHRDHEWWSFTYRGTDFNSFEPVLILPTKAQLDSILSTLESLMPELRTRLKKGLSEWSDSKLDDGETCSLDVQEFAKDGTFSVSWSDGASWGDMGVEYTIKDHAIIDESWGD